MPTSEITYQGNLRTEATHLKSGTTIITDAPVDNQGNGEAFSPTDLVATSLGNCMLTIMGIAARNHDIDMVGAKVSITKVMSSDPRRISKIEVIMNMPPNDYSAKQKKILERAAHGCPVHHSLHPEIEVDFTLFW